MCTHDPLYNSSLLQYDLGITQPVCKNILYRKMINPHPIDATNEIWYQSTKSLQRQCHLKFFQNGNMVAKPDIGKKWLNLAIYYPKLCFRSLPQTKFYLDQSVKLFGRNWHVKIFDYQSMELLGWYSNQNW